MHPLHDFFINSAGGNGEGVGSGLGVDGPMVS